MSTLSPTDLGLPPKNGVLNLSAGGTFEWSYEWQAADRSNYPVGAELYLMVGTTKWEFVIAGKNATIAKDPTAVDAVADRTPFSLRFKKGTSVRILVIGKVKKWEAK